MRFRSVNLCLPQLSASTLLENPRQTPSVTGGADVEHEGEPRVEVEVVAVVVAVLCCQLLNRLMVNPP